MKRSPFLLYSVPLSKFLLRKCPLLMNKLSKFAENKDKGGIMKELYTLLGFGAGMLAGMVLYKHNMKAKTVYNNGEKVVLDKLNQTEKDAKVKMQEMKDKADDKLDETVDMINKKAKKIKKKLQ